MDKNSFNIIKAVFLIVIISLLSIISILQTNNKDNLSSAITPQPPTPTYKNPTKSNNPDIDYYNTLSGSNEENLYKVIIKDNYYVVGSTSSTDGDFCDNTQNSIFISKINKSGTLLKTITLPYQNYYDCVDYKNNLVITMQNIDNYILYVNYNLELTMQKTQDSYNNLYVVDDQLYGYSQYSGNLYNIQDNTYYNVGYDNYVLDNLFVCNGSLLLFLRQDTFVIVKINQNEVALILELENITFVGSQYMQEFCFVSVIIDDMLLINKIDYDGTIIFCHEIDIANPNFIYIIKQTNGYDIYISSDNIATKVFLCTHGDEIYREILDFGNIKYITNNNDSLIIIGTTQAHNTIIKTTSCEYIINGGEIENIYFDNILNVLFCQSNANSLDLLSNGLVDIYLFKLNTKI